MSEAALNNIAIAQSDSLFQEALSLYKAKQYEEAVFHFSDASKAGGLFGGEAEYYIGHIYADKLNDSKKAEKYLNIAFEKKHILPSKYLDLIVPEADSGKGKGDLSAAKLKDEIKKTEEALANTLQKTNELELNFQNSLKSAASFNNDTINPHVFGGAIIDAKSKLSQFWANYLGLVKEKVFRYDLMSQDYGVTFPASFEAKDRARFEKQICQCVQIKTALDFMINLDAREYPIIAYLEKLIAMNTPRKLLYQYAIKMIPQQLTEKLSVHLAAKMCRFIPQDFADRESTQTSMIPLLADFCGPITTLFLIAKLLGFRHYSSKNKEKFQSDLHENKDNISNFDDENEEEGSHVLISMLPGFVDSNNQIISKEMILTINIQ